MATQGERQAAAEVLAKARAKTARVKLCLDGDLLDQHAQLSEQLAAAQAVDEQSNRPATAPKIAKQIVQLEQQIEAAEVEFVFRAVGRSRWRQLLADNPPTDEQKEQGAEFDVDTFPLLVMSESLVEPSFTVDELAHLIDEILSEADFAQIWGACLRCHLGGGSRPSSSAARAIAQSSRGRSKPQPESVSDGPSSSDDD